jgi:hypothetical protein
MASNSIASEVYQQAQDLWSSILSLSDAFADENTNNLNEWPEISDACAQCSTILIGDSIATVLQKRTDMHLIESVDELLNDPRDTLLSQFAHPVEFRRDRRALSSGMERGCRLCAILVDLDRRCNTPGRRLSDPTVGITSIGEGNRRTRGADQVSFYVARDEHFSSMLKVAVSDHTQKFLMLEVSAPEGMGPTLQCKLSAGRRLIYHILGQPMGVLNHPAGFLFPGQLVHLDVGSDRSFAMARGWIEECNLNHENCPNLDQRPLPTRVLEILPNSTAQDIRVRLHNSDHQLGKYAALSYCWGGPQPITTTRDTESVHHVGITFQKLPQTIKDALLCTLKLGLHYLWVDALCILQDPDSLEDKKREIKAMADIYRNAYITIQATNAKSCRDGFLQIRKQRTDAIRLPCEYADNRFSDIVVSPAVDIVMPRPGLQEPINDRAWTLQEGLLSSRVLIYSEAQLYFKCLCGFQKDGGQSTWMTYTLGTGTTRVAQENLSLLGHVQGTAQPTAHQIREYWERVVVDFTARGITDPADKLPALSGVARSFAAHTGDTYLAGCWQMDILYDICWMPGNDARIPERHHRVLPETTRCKAWRAPTWSWASVDGPVWFPSERDLIPGEGVFQLDQELEFLHCEYATSTPEDLFGQVAANSGRLVLKGHLKSLQGTYYHGLQIETTDGLVPASFQSKLPLSELRKRPYAGETVVLGSITLDTFETTFDCWKRIYDNPSWWCFLLGSFMTEEEMPPPVVRPGSGYAIVWTEPNPRPEATAFGLVLSRDPLTGHFQRVGVFRGNTSNAPLRITRRDLLDWFRDCEVQKIAIV